MTIYDALRHEHYVIRAFIKRIQDLGERRPATRRRHFDQLQLLLGVHAAATEAIFHAPLLEHEATATLARKGRIRQDVAGSLLELIAAMEPADPDWTAYFAVLAEVLEQDMRQQEKELFRRARKVLDDATAQRMGEEMLLVGKGSEVMARAEIQPPVATDASRSLH